MENLNSSSDVELMNSLHLELYEDGLDFNYGQGLSTGHIEWNKSHKIQKEFWEKKGIFSSQISQVDVHIFHQHFLLIPHKYDSPVYRIGFLEKALGEETLVGQEIHIQNIPSENANLLYLIPSDWKDIVNFWFPLAQISYHHDLEQVIMNSQDHGISISINHQKASIVLRKSGNLVLANIYPFSKATELAFYIHSIRDTYLLKWNPDSIHWIGEIDINLAKELSTFKIYPPSISHEA